MYAEKYLVTTAKFGNELISTRLNADGIVYQILQLNIPNTIHLLFPPSTI